MRTSGLYDRDFFAWTQRNAELLRAGRFDQADIEHIAEEIEDMGRSERRELDSRLEVLLQHLLKWRAQPDRRGRSWTGTIPLQRRELNKLLSQMPSLKPALAKGLKEAYRGGVVRASIETDIPQFDFPRSCPFTLDEILDPDFFPE
jgi:hypothetical protein